MLSLDDKTNMDIACSGTTANGPADRRACYRQQLTALGYPITPSRSTTSSGSSGAYTSSTAGHPACAENGSCYGDISSATGLPKTVYVPGYYKSNGTYVHGYYRSK